MWAILAAAASRSSRLLSSPLLSSPLIHAPLRRGSLPKHVRHRRRVVMDGGSSSLLLCFQAKDNNVRSFFIVATQEAAQAWLKLLYLQTRYSKFVYLGPKDLEVVVEVANVPRVSTVDGNGWSSTQTQPIFLSRPRGATTRFLWCRRAWRVPPVLHCPQEKLILPKLPATKTLESRLPPFFN